VLLVTFLCLRELPVGYNNGSESSVSVSNMAGCSSRFSSTSPSCPCPAIDCTEESIAAGKTNGSIIFSEGKEKSHDTTDEGEKPTEEPDEPAPEPEAGLKS
jgi:hypothetical protein